MTEDLLISRPAAFARGLNGDDIKRRAARGDWRIVRRGIYVSSASVADLAPEELHRLRVTATVAQLDGPHVVSHLSAACLHGIDQLRVPGDVVHVTNPATHSGHRRRTLRTFCAALDPDEITTVHGCPVTTVVRTIVDVARIFGFDAGVIATDHALRRGLVKPDSRSMRSRVHRTVVATPPPAAFSRSQRRQGCSRVLIARRSSIAA